MYITNTIHILLLYITIITVIIVTIVTILLLLLIHMMRCPSRPGTSNHVQAFHHFVYCPCSGTPTIYSYGGAFYDSGLRFSLDRILDGNGRALTDLAVA